jgi:hypothetical protein
MVRFDLLFRHNRSAASGYSIKQTLNVNSFTRREFCSSSQITRWLMREGADHVYRNAGPIDLFSKLPSNVGRIVAVDGRPHRPIVEFDIKFVVGRE